VVNEEYNYKTIETQGFCLLMLIMTSVWKWIERFGRLKGPPSFLKGRVEELKTQTEKRKKSQSQK
jgi:hypothetical protein